MTIKIFFLAKISATVAFIMGSCIVSAQEFTYDANGSLKTDGNKQVSSIHYNHLNLVDTILYADGRKMIYTYSASGQKLREQSFLANGTVKQKRDYSGHILYRNDSLREIQNEDGRTVPIIPGNTATAWEYQYNLTDHLGNVRSLLTSKQETAASVATYEITSAATEQSDYLRYTSARKINSALFDHTHTGTTHYSERLNGSANEKYGIARSLSVMPGDTIKLEAYAKYLDPNKNNWTQALNTLVTQIASGTAPVGTMIDGSGYATNGTTPFPFAGLNGTSSSSGSGPKAYLNWLVFDRNYIFKNGGYVKLSEAAKENGSNVKHEKLEKQLTIREAGYVYVYLSNEEATPVEVYFDDVSVTQVKGPVIQEIDYDPFGLTFNEYSRENTALNNFLYNGKEQQKDFDLNWYDYGARMYDAALGRWHVIDPMAEKYASWSPYNYVMNNPIRHIDPNGEEPAQIQNISKTNIHAEADNQDELNKLTQAFEKLKQAPEGRRIINDIHNKNVSVHVRLHNGMIRIKHEGNTIDALGAEGALERNEGISVVSRNGHFFINNDPTSDFSVFNGLDVTDEILNHKDIRLVLAVNSNLYDIAKTLAHELDSHINIPLLPIFSGTGLSAELQHVFYGENLTPNGITGSTSDKIYEQLKKIKSTDDENSLPRNMIGPVFYPLVIPKAFIKN